MVKILNNLINKKDVLGVVEGMAGLYEDDDAEYEVLEALYNMLNSLTPLNIVEAGNVNIICEDVYQMAKYLENKKDEPKIICKD